MNEPRFVVRCIISAQKNSNIEAENKQNEKNKEMANNEEDTKPDKANYKEENKEENKTDKVDRSNEIDSNASECSKTEDVKKRPVTAPSRTNRSNEEEKQKRINQSNFKKALQAPLFKLMQKYFLI